MSNTFTVPASINGQPPTPPPNALDTTPGADPTSPTVHYQLSSGHVASLPQSSVPALLKQDGNAKQIPTPASGQVLVQLSSGHTATLPSTSLPALKQQDPNFKYIAGDAPADYQKLPTPEFDTISAVTGPHTMLGATDVSPVASDSRLGSFHVIEGSLLEKAIQKFNPAFRGSVTKDENQAYLDSRALQQAPVDAAQFINKDTHPVAKALTEAGQSLLSPANIAILYSTGGLGLVDNPASMQFASRLISGGFSARAIADAYQHYKGFREAVDQKNWSEAEYQITHSVISGSLGVLAGKQASEGAASTVSDAVNRIPNPFRKVAQIANDVRQGKSVAQEPATAAVRTGVDQSTTNTGTANPTLSAGIKTNPILAGNVTVIDEPLSALAAKERAAYKAIDSTVGFDLKAAKDDLANKQYEVKQPQYDNAQRISMSQDIDSLNAKIADAEKKLTDAGLDPKAGDVVHTQRMAGTDFKNALVRATAPDGTINVDKLLNSSKALRFTKRGDRLSQFMGADAADDFVDQLQDAQKAGIKAVDRQKFWSGIGKGAIKAIPYIGAVGLGGYEAIKHIPE